MYKIRQVTHFCVELIDTETEKLRVVGRDAIQHHLMVKCNIHPEDTFIVSY